MRKWRLDSGFYMWWAIPKTTSEPQCDSSVHPKWYSAKVLLLLRGLLRLSKHKDTCLHVEACILTILIMLTCDLYINTSCNLLLSVFPSARECPGRISDKLLQYSGKKIGDRLEKKVVLLLMSNVCRISQSALCAVPSNFLEGKMTPSPISVSSKSASSKVRITDLPLNSELNVLTLITDMSFGLRKETRLANINRITSTVLSLLVICWRESSTQKLLD